MRNLPRGVDSPCLDGWPGGEIPSKTKVRLLETMFTLLDVRPENQTFVITMSTLSMCQNRSFFFLTWGMANKNLHIWATPRIIITCRVPSEALGGIWKSAYNSWACFQKIICRFLYVSSTPKTRGESRYPQGGGPPEAAHPFVEAVRGHLLDFPCVFVYFGFWGRVYI